MQKIEVGSVQVKSPLGIGCIDSLLNGGLENGIITEIYGEGGSGKTNICMQFSINVAKSGRRVYYLDSEGFSTERFRQMSVSDPQIYDEIALFRINSLEDQELSLLKVQKLLEKTKVPGAVVLDSFTEYFRLEATGDSQARISGFQKQLSILISIASDFSIPVLISNQIYQDIGSGSLQPFGGFVIDHAVKAILSLEKGESGIRKIRVVKHRSIEEGRSTSFRIVSTGLECA